MFRKSLNILLSLSLFGALTACQDDLLYDDTQIPDGEAMVTASVDFHPLVETETNPDSRSQKGDAVKNIENLSVFVYDAEGKLLNIYNDTDFADYKVFQKNEEGSNTDMPNDAGGKPVQSEESTSRATFTLKNMPFGKYYIYAVANMGRFENNEDNKKRFANVKDLKAIKVEWDAKDISKNNAMFGYFTLTGNDTETSDGFSAPLVPVSQKHVQLHAWIKRTVSKVTIVYDGSGLHEDIWVYIKSVTIKDIPRYCAIGEENTVKTTSSDSMIVNGDCIYYGGRGELAAGAKPSDNYEDWMQIANGTPKRGAVTLTANDSVTEEHSEYHNALYFFENCQGDYEGQKEYDKHQLWDEVGYVINKPDQYGYKDNVKYGTYIEVEAYYVSKNVKQVTNGPIKYRYMLGQNDTYNYDAFRNHHYKLTLGFKGYANQPDWHIEYVEPEITYFVDPTYYVSYAYNNKAIFPIRFKGDVEEFDVEIVENNWAPYDPTKADSVPDQSVGEGNLRFQWNRPVYMNESNNFYYGLQKPYKRDGSSQITYSADEIKKGAPEKVTPIWAGFLALMVPDNLTATILEGSGKTYETERERLKTYFYGKGEGNNVAQNYRNFTKADLTFSNWKGGTSVSKTVGTGNNKCEIVKAADGSITLQLPTWTRPKSMLGISGFTGNNPYDTYQRKAVLKLSAKFKGGKELTKYMPIYQVRRVVNPKGVWRQWNDNQSFHVKLMRREGADETQFKSFKSQGAWRAYVRQVSPGAEGFIELTGGIGTDKDGAVYGNTDSYIDFTINFKGKGAAGKALCGIVTIEYHGFTCNHSIFVRQGYYEPITIMNNTRWSSFNLFKCDVAKHTSGVYNGWTVPNGTKPTAANYISAEITQTPISMSTLFKRGNYAEGILIENNFNTALGPLVNPGSTNMKLTNNAVGLPWTSIDGYAYTRNDKNKVPDDWNDPQRYTWKWGRFKVKVNGEDRYYRVPTYDDFHSLLSGEYGIGVLYADGATEPATDVNVAYGFVDINNDGSDDYYGTAGVKGGPSGMRGFIVFNPSNAHQIFFPLGSNGIGRRTIQNATGDMRGVLRYGAVRYTLDQKYPDGTDASYNQYRPIPYNLPASPGSIYWIESAYGGYGGAMLGWDMNYFDLNFNGYDYACGFWPTGDALPMKLVIDESGPWPAGKHW